MSVNNSGTVNTESGANSANASNKGVGSDNPKLNEEVAQASPKNLRKNLSGEVLDGQKDDVKKKVPEESDTKKTDIPTQGKTDTEEPEVKQRKKKSVYKKNYLDRAVDEQIGLENKISKLDKFINSGDFDVLKPGEKGLLKRQYRTMRTYNDILIERISKKN